MESAQVVTGLVVATVSIASLERRAVPNEPDNNEYEKEAKYVAKDDDNQPDAVVLHIIKRRDGRGWRWEAIDGRRMSGRSVFASYLVWAEGGRQFGKMKNIQSLSHIIHLKVW